MGGRVLEERGRPSLVRGEWLDGIDREGVVYNLYVSIFDRITYRLGTSKGDLPLVLSIG